MSNGSTEHTLGLMYGHATGCYAQITCTPVSNKIIGIHIKLTLISNVDL